MRRMFKYCFFILFLFAVQVTLTAQTVNTVAAAETKIASDLTISYALSIKAEKKNGIAESYNGASKTIFIGNNQVRSRLVSLMRVQSIFYKLHAGNREVVTLLKESGKERTKIDLTATEWKEYNRKYDDAVVELKEDSVTIHGYVCKLAMVKLKDGRLLNVYYTSELQYPMLALVEPAFKDIPGLVLQYEYANEHAVFTYTVTGISKDKIDPEVFKSR
jgi:GLPGLI family protein